MCTILLSIFFILNLMKFLKRVSIEKKHCAARLLTQFERVVVLADGELADRMLCDNISIHTVEDERQTGLRILTLLYVWVDNQFAFTVNDAVNTSDQHLHGEATVQ